MIFFEERKPVVLIVDDEPINIQILASLLNRDYELKVACDGQAALEIAARTPQPDLILLDIMMPGMDGFEVCHQLKTNAHTQAIPVIFVTAAGPASEVKCFELGAVDYIAKPINATVTRLRVKTQLDIVRLRKAHLESLAFLSSLIDHVPVMIGVLSKHGQCLLMNKMLLNVLDYADLSAAQADIEAGRFNVIDARDFKHLRRSFLKTLVSGQHQSLGLAFQHQEKKYTLEVRLSPLKNTQAQVVAVCILAIEIGDLKSRLEPSHWLANVFENTLDGLVLADLHEKQ